MPNERQLATLILLGALMIFSVSHPKIRSSIKDVASSAAHAAILVPVAAMLVYVAAIIFGAWRLGWWLPDLTTDAVFWFAGSALVLLLNIERVWKQERFFRKAALAAIGVTAAVEFFVNDIFVFNLPAELLLAIGLLLLVMMSAVTEGDPQYAALKRTIDRLIAGIGIGLLFYLTSRTILSWDTIDKGVTLRAFVMPIWLLLTLLPFICLVSLYAAYERAFGWIDFKATEGTAHWPSKLALLLRLSVRLRRVAAVTGYWGREIREAQSFTGAWRKVGDFLSFLREARRRETEAENRLSRFASVEGADDDGRRLDQREFKETAAALMHLATAQMGWYRNCGGRYRTELLEILASNFEQEGLSSAHGIHLNVSEDGQTWWAWRRTVSGWCFGIGAAGPPPDQWLFEGSEPPKDGPDREDALWSHWGAESINW